MNITSTLNSIDLALLLHISHCNISCVYPHMCYRFVAYSCVNVRLALISENKFKMSFAHSKWKYDDLLNMFNFNLRWKFVIAVVNYDSQEIVLCGYVIKHKEPLKILSCCTGTKCCLPRNIRPTLRSKRLVTLSCTFLNFTKKS